MSRRRCSMSVSRREFVAILAGLPVALTGRAQCRKSMLTPAGNDLKVTNYNEDGRYSLTEGKTLLVGLSFPETPTDLFGSLPVKIEPKSPGTEKLTEPQPLFFYNTGDARTFHMFVAAPLDVIEGPYSANMGGRYRSDDLHWELRYFIRRGNYRQSLLTVDRSFSQPTPAMKLRMQADFETMRDIYLQRTPRRWWGPFMRPVPGPYRHNFGDKRTYNDTKHLRHAGLDFRARMGTPVSAINDGIVVLSTEQWAAGQAICIDHGGGVFSKYIHLSRRNAQAGDDVKRGQIIALSGNSGAQKPAPHLHLDVVVGGVHVDPIDFMHVASRLLAVESHRQRTEW